MSTQAEVAAATLTYREAVNAALLDAMEHDERVLLMGEDVGADGGVFKTNHGLAERFPGRVLNTPICENTFVGAAIGMAATGLRPVVEIMFSASWKVPMFVPPSPMNVIATLPEP